MKGGELSIRPDLTRDNGSGDGSHATCRRKMSGGDGKEISRSRAGWGCLPGRGMKTATPEFDDEQLWLRSHHFTPSSF